MGATGDRQVVGLAAPGVKRYKATGKRPEGQSAMTDSDGFRLVSVSLRKYRSIRQCDVRLGPLTVLVGPNGSGKSNFLDALRFVSEALQGSLDQALRARGGIREVHWRGGGRNPSLAIQLEFRMPEVHGVYAVRILGASGLLIVTREYCTIWPGQDSAGGQSTPIHHYEVREGKLVTSSEAVMPPPPSNRLYLTSVAGLEPFDRVFEALGSINVYNVDPDAIRAPQPPGEGDLLDRGGRNIASVLRRLGSESASDKHRIERYLSQIVPGVTSVEPRSVGSWDTLMFSQEVGSGRSSTMFPATSMSDGTLRALGVLVALFSPPGTASTVGIEEPESALHPAAAGVLLDALRFASERRQVLVTSHSPDLLDSHDFTADELRAVRLTDGATVIDELDDAAKLALSEELFTAGQLLRVDQLQPRSSADPNGEAAER